MKRSPCLNLVLLVSVAATFCGCAHLTEAKMERELEMVARRWCMTLRASQIIPIYPLNEDVQPGDVFVVETPAQRQASDYNRRGYLDLEHLLVRLNPTCYSNFYFGGYGIGLYTNTPRHWQSPSSLGWSNAPLAGFPTYSVDVKKGGGFNAAFPISGIPVGLSFVSGAQAKVNVQLTGAHTFGLDQASLESPFRQWLSTNADLTAQFARPTNGNRTAFLRLVTRVFLVDTVNVTVTGDEASSFGGSGGAAKSVELPNLQDSNAVANYTSSISALGSMVETLAESAPGGSLKLASASSRSISFNETFARPMVIGYLAQDYPILEDNRLGNPISTKDVLEGRIPDPLALSLAKLHNEQKEAALVADQCVSRVQRLTTDQLKASLGSATTAAIISEQEKSQILGKLSQNRDEALKDYAKAIRLKSLTGDVRDRCDLRVFLEALAKLQP